jgi:multiple sugar transport system permease protein
VRRAVFENLQGWLFVLPALAILAVFHFLPGFAALGMSFMRWGVVPERFTGIDNYVAILDPGGPRFEEFANSVGVTFWYVLLTVPVEMVLGLVVAYLLFEKIFARGAYRTVYFLPYVTSTVAAAAIFAWIFNPQNGFLNFLLGLVGIGPQTWTQQPRGLFELVGSAFGLTLTGPFAGPSLALVSVAILTVWHYVGFQTVIFMAGLANIGKEYYEAARVDGANERQIFFRITLPLLSPTTFFVLVVATIGTMRSFNEIYVLTTATGQATPGGPLGTTTTLTLEIFKTFFQRTANNGIGLGAAMSFILVTIILVLTFVQFRVIGRRVQYE